MRSIEEHRVVSRSPFYGGMLVGSGAGIGNESYAGWPAEGQMPEYPEAAANRAREALAMIAAKMITTPQTEASAFTPGQP